MICLKCKKEFNLNQKGSGGHNRLFCYSCLPIINDRSIRNKFKSNLTREFIKALKLDLGCSICGYSKCSKALEWHHIGDDKEGEPSVLSKLNITKYLNEIKKCILVCANCHREIHDND